MVKAMHAKLARARALLSDYGVLPVYTRVRADKPN
jgi:hypothetical protein